MYVVIKQIQSGSFSTVYKAWCDRLQQHVALKVIPKKVYADEIETMELLGARHPGICSMLNWYEDEFNYVLVLEYCSGGDLHDFMEFSKKQKVSERPLNLSSIIAQIDSAIRYAHSLGVAHRDIKPENILLTENGDVKLADWGHAIWSRVSTDSNVGTDAYRSPETYTGNAYDTFKADYWSFGVTILYLIFGRPPFRCYSVNGIKMQYPFHCANFANFLIDPQLTMYHTYVLPLLQSGLPRHHPFMLEVEPQDSICTGRNSLLTYELIHLCRSVTEKLVNINVEQRNLDDFMGAITRSNNMNATSFLVKPTLPLANIFRMIKVKQN